MFVWKNIMRTWKYDIQINFSEFIHWSLKCYKKFFFFICWILKFIMYMFYINWKKNINLRLAVYQLEVVRKIIGAKFSRTITFRKSTTTDSTAFSFANWINSNSIESEKKMLYLCHRYEKNRIKKRYFVWGHWTWWRIILWIVLTLWGPLFNK